MPRYMWQVSYTAEGARGLLEEGGSARRAAVEQMAQAMGGSIEGFYYALGETDVYVIGEAPSNADASAVSLAVGASGAAEIRTVVLLTPEEVDEAAKKSVSYRPPGS